MNYILDTHTWIWFNSDPVKLSRQVRSLLASSANYNQLYVSAISIWEFSKLIQKGRLRIGIEGNAWIDEALTIEKLEIAPITPHIAWQSCNLPGSFHDDPADQIIVATARELNCKIITKDKLIQNYKHVATIW